MSAKPKKLVLAVIDALKPEMLDRAVEHGRAPALKTLLEHGTYVRDCVSTFPSVTPVAAATITTGVLPDEHDIPSMNWYLRGEERYVEYGSSFEASRTFGLLRSLYDTVYNLNLAHLSRDVPTVFERLMEAGIRTAGTTYLVYRGHKRHPALEGGIYGRLARVGGFRHAVWGPDEFFYADLFDSRRTDCRSTLGMPGQRDQHAACVGAHLVENDLCEFMLLSLPDNDTHSHKRGPFAQVTSIASADRALERVMHVAGGPRAFLEDHAVIVMSDHAQVAVSHSVNLLAEAFAERKVLGAEGDPLDAEIAVCPSQRSAQVYVLEPERRRELLPLLVSDLQVVDGVDVVAWREGPEAAVWSRRGELRFSPGGDLTDPRAGSWHVDGDLETLELKVEDGRVDSEEYPLALARLWSALGCPHGGDVLVSAAGGYEFVDWGGVAHIGGGSHGSLARGDSHAALLMCGLDVPSHDQWTIADVTPLVLDHFSVAS
ncbi:MAG: alkaline phosphatase family protein [Actinomycetota bacterium]|nr:alkaline phosphatase family protein [Actinomycetota bacterium]